MKPPHDVGSFRVVHISAISNYPSHLNLDLATMSLKRSNPSASAEDGPPAKKSETTETAAMKPTYFKYNRGTNKKATTTSTATKKKYS